MSILTEVMHGRLSFHDGAAKATQWAASLVAHDAALKPAADQLLSDVKQGISNAADLADKALSQMVGPMTQALEVAADAALSTATKGASVPFNPLLNNGIETISGAIVAFAHEWELKVKAAAAQTATSQADFHVPQPPAA